jgi:hypothetical protein
VAVSATKVHAQISATFSVSGNLIPAATTAKCTGLAYPALCPADHNCSCYKISKASLHSTTILGKKLPPGTTKAFFAVDSQDGTGSHGTCEPVYGEVSYSSNDGVDSAQIFAFGSLCTPFKPDPLAEPFVISGGGAIERAIIDFFPVSGYGIATGTYTPGQTFTLSLEAVVQ